MVFLMAQHTLMLSLVGVGHKIGRLTIHLMTTNQFGGFLITPI